MCNSRNNMSPLRTGVAHTRAKCNAVHPRQAARVIRFSVESERD
jgi:hypothetical protein